MPLIAPARAFQAQKCVEAGSLIPEDEFEIVGWVDEQVRGPRESRLAHEQADAQAGSTGVFAGWSFYFEGDEFVSLWPTQSRYFS